MATLRDSWTTLSWWQKTLIILTTCVALYAAFGFLLLPRIVHYVLVEKVSPVLDRQISVDDIRMNPFALTADITGFSIAERSGDGEFVAFDSLHTNLELSSLPRLALVIRETRLQGPRITIRLDENGRTNFADLTEGPKDPKPETEERMLFPVIVEPFSLGNGTIVFKDEIRDVTHVVDRIDFELPRFSSRKKDWETFMTPTLSFRVNGAPFNLEGETIPFSDSLKTEFDLDMVDLGLPRYWAYVPVNDSLQLSKGLLNLETKLAFEQHEDRLPTFSLQGTVTGRDIELTDAGKPVLTAESAQVVMEDISILNLQLGLSSIRLDNPFVNIVRRKDGSLNWAGYFVTAPASKDVPAKTHNATDTAEESPGKTGNLTMADNAATAGNATLAENSTMDGNATAAANATETGNATLTAQGEPENATASTVQDSDQATEEQRALLLRVPEIRLTGGRILFEDKVTSFAKEMRDLDLTITDLDTSAGATTLAELRAITGEGEELGADASFSISPFSLETRVTARNLAIPSYAPYFRDALPMSLTSAKADADISLVQGEGESIPRVTNSSVEIRDLALGAPDGAGDVRINRIFLDGIGLDTAARQMRTGVLSIDGTTVTTAVGKDGRATLPDALNQPAKSGAGQAAPASAPDGNATAWTIASGGAALNDMKLTLAGNEPTSPVRMASLKVGPVSVNTGAQAVNIGAVALSLAVEVERLRSGDIDLARLFAPKTGGGEKSGDSTPSPWQVSVEKFSLAESSLAFTDRTPARASRIDVDRITLQTGALSTDLSKSIPLDFSCRIEESGTIKASGDLVPDSLVSGGRVDISRIPLSLVAPYVADAVAVGIPSGRLGGRLNWSMGGRGGDRISGGLQIDGLRITEERSREEVVGFRTLALRDIDLRLDPLRLSLREAELVEPNARFAIDAEGRTTLDRIQASDAKEPKPSADKESSGGLKSLDIGTFALKDGRFIFTDKTLSPQFASIISPVNLNVRGITLDPDSRADLTLSAVIDGTAPLNATGWVSPLKDPVEANSTVTLRNLDLVALSPYSAKFIAYPVAQGQLDWDMDLSTEGSNLAMRNAIKARQLELGDKVESPDAVNAPVKLGLALLRDMSGNISINLPVKGDLNDPKFSIGGIVVQAFIGLIVKAVASPFSLLASLVPEGSGDISKIAFPPGLAIPAEDGSNSIQALADVLSQRPGVSISIAGHADPAADRQAIADRIFLRKLQVAKYEELSRREREQAVLEELEITEEEYADILWEAYTEEPVEKKKNFLGIHEDVPREEQEAKLRELIDVTDEDLIRLAAGRAEFVKTRLVQELGIGADRVFLGSTGPAALSGTHDVTVEIRK
jgi:uncharacterized protein involved in outer membrane biogenesis